MPLRCLIVEDQVMFLQLLCTLLQPVRDLEIVGTATTCGQGIEHCLSLEPDLLILDLSLPDGDGLQVARQCLQHLPGCQVVVLSAQASSFVCPADLQPSVVDVIDKTATFQAVQAALHDVLIQKAISRSQPSLSDPLRLLTPRQREVFRLIGQGLLNKEIARRTGLEVATVETHRKTIARRLRVSGAELVRLAALQAIELEPNRPHQAPESP